MSDPVNPIPFSLNIPEYELSAERWVCANAKATVVIIHGFGEHKGRYAHVAKSFAENGLETYLLDLPGHGKSTGRRGHVKHIEVHLDAIDALISKVKQDHINMPLALFGHSLGGGLVARYLVEKPKVSVAATIISSPWIKLALKPPRRKLLMGRVALKFGLSLSQSADLDPTLLSRDPKVQKAFTEDTLVNNCITPQTFFAILDSGDYLLDHSYKPTFPILITHGTDDQITNADASRQLAEEWGDQAIFKYWEGAKHEPHNDTGREEVVAFYTEWLVEKLEVGG